jgi:hypothetical protein
MDELPGPEGGDAATGEVGTGDATVDSLVVDSTVPPEVGTSQDALVAPDSAADDSFDTSPVEAGDATAEADAKDTSETGVADAADAESGPDAVVDAAETSTDTGAIDAANAGDGTSDALTAYRHTITIDGTNDFVAGAEKLPTTTTPFDADVTWDASALYVGYVGPDLGATASNTKWLFVYLDRDPGAATGATKTAQYASQQHSLPSGFGAEVYFGQKTDGSFSVLKTWTGTSWVVATTNPVTVARNAASNFVEIRVPLSVLQGSPPARVGVVTFLLSEISGGEWTWAGLWNGSFVDGTSLATSPLKISAYLLADFSSPLAPNSFSNKKP